MPGAKEHNYLAIIGDLVGSRALDDQKRAEVQQRFKAGLDGINRSFAAEIASRFLITAGDEMQGILRRPLRTYEIIRKLQIQLSPTEIVLGLGYGILTTEIGEYAVGADGPAFHRARRALEQAKEERKAYGKSILREVRLNSDEALPDKVINALYLALAVMKNSWTDRQREVLHRLESGQRSSEIGEALSMPLSNVSRVVETTHFREYEQIVECVKGLFGSYTYLNNDK